MKMIISLFFLGLMTVEGLSAAVNFKQAFQFLESSYRKEAKSLYGLNLRVNEVKARGLLFAGYQVENGNFEVSIGTENMLSLPHMTEAAVLFSACHEVGHLLARKYGPPFLPEDKMAIEGEADFFAASECMPLILKHKKFHPEEFAWEMKLALFSDEAMKFKNFFERTCEKVSDDKKASCPIILLAGVSLAYILADLEQESAPLNLVEEVLSPTNEILIHHPSSICRFQGLAKAFLSNERHECWWR